MRMRTVVLGAVAGLLVVVGLVPSCGDDDSDPVDVGDTSDVRSDDARADGDADADADADAGAEADGDADVAEDIAPPGTCTPDPLPRSMELACYPDNCCGFPEPMCFTMLAGSTSHDGCASQFLADDGAYYQVECGDATPYPTGCECFAHVPPFTDECAGFGADADADADAREDADNFAAADSG